MLKIVSDMDDSGYYLNRAIEEVQATRVIKAGTGPEDIKTILMRQHLILAIQLLTLSAIVEGVE